MNDYSTTQITREEREECIINVVPFEFSFSKEHTLDNYEKKSREESKIGVKALYYQYLAIFQFITQITHTIYILSKRVMVKNIVPNSIKVSQISQVRQGFSTNFNFLELVGKCCRICPKSWGGKL